MEILREILLTLHLLGMAIIVGGYFTVIRSPKVLAGMLHASYLQLLTGLALLTLAEMGDGQVDHVKIGLKLVIAILVTVFAFLGRRQEKEATEQLTPGLPGTTAGPAGPARPAGPATQTIAPASVTNPSARLAHLTFSFAVLNVLIAVFLR
ncbi:MULTISPECIES: hypothetical protein [unclassified Brevibacterium]|uniref:hypothetical protein n=1 Tax=unclassified Brevibacterium TaxID=2614124 RepID=UPI001E355C7E|nr:MULTISPECIES: hypothetical protein [unclassified Brevibacterium]MCD1284269.1 hypothetical protein [Brevibacterium sp. CCUG 69071]MDK8436121.1 hypothetical protein [Brevibacterium sp. H-BE7]